MKNVRLYHSATIVGDAKGASDNSDKVLTKRARLVYEGEFDSMDGKVKVTADHLKSLAAAHNEQVAKLSGPPNPDAPGAEPSMANYPPVQVDHSTSGWDTVGRVIGPLELGDYEGKVALFGNLRFLGSDAVERVKDGRWTHLSLGADLDGAKLNEMTVTPFPAAPKASLLKGKKDSESEVELGPLWEKAKKASQEAFGEIRWPFVNWWYQEHGGKFSKGESMDKEKLAALKKHLMEKEKLSEKDADDKLAKMKDEEKEELSAKLAGDEGGKVVDKPKGADEEEEEVEKGTKDEPTAASKKMAAARSRFAKLSKGFKKVSDSTIASISKVQLTGKLNGLRAKGKLSPGEQKAIDLDKLASLDKAGQDFFFETYEKRSPIVLAGVYGRADASDIVELANDVKGRTMLTEMLEGMQFSKSVVRRLAGMPTSMDTNQASQHMAEANIGSSVGNDTSMPTSMDTPMQMSAHEHFKHLHKLLSEGQHEEAMKHLKSCMAAGEGQPPQMPGGTEGPAHLSALAENVQSLQNQFKELVELVTPILETEVQ